MNIMFVCTGNTCRSPMAEAYFWRLCEKAGLEEKVDVWSAGTLGREGMPAASGAIEVMNGLGIDISDHESSALDEEMIEDADLIVTMTSTHRLQIGTLAPEAMHKTVLLKSFVDEPEVNINDPIGGTSEDYQKCFEEMKSPLDNLFLEVRGKCG